MIKSFIILTLILFSHIAKSAEIRVVEKTQNSSLFGELQIYYQDQTPQRVILLLLNEATFQRSAQKVAYDIAQKDNLVIVIHLQDYQKEAERKRCLTIGNDLDQLAKSVQSQIKLAHYQRPVLLSYGAAAPYLREALRQMPRKNFLGGMSLNYCANERPALPTCGTQNEARKQTDQNSGKIPGGVFLPRQPAALENLPEWLVIKSSIDAQSCAAKAKVEKNFGRSLDLQEARSGESETWFPQAMAQLESSENGTNLVASSSDDDALPLLEFPAEKNKTDTFAIFYTGDGGWRDFAKEFANSLATHGTPVVGISTVYYLWEKKSPEKCAADLAKLMSKYQQLWKLKKVHLIGFSSGADILPFAISRLPENLKKNIKSVSLLALGRKVEFEFHFANLITNPDSGQPIAPELARLKGLRVQCVYGEEDAVALCPELNGSGVRVVRMPGGHRFHYDTDSISNLILDREDEVKK